MASNPELEITQILRASERFFKECYEDTLDAAAARFRLEWTHRNEISAFQLNDASRPNATAKKLELLAQPVATSIQDGIYLIHANTLFQLTSDSVERAYNGLQKLILDAEQHEATVSVQGINGTFGKIYVVTNTVPQYVLDNDFNTYQTSDRKHNGKSTRVLTNTTPPLPVRFFK